MADLPVIPHRLFNPIAKYEGIRHKDEVAEHYILKTGIRYAEMNKISAYTRSNYSRPRFMERLSRYIRPSPVAFVPSSLWLEAEKITAQALFGEFDPSNRVIFTDLSQVPFQPGSTAGPWYNNKTKGEAHAEALAHAQAIMEKYPEASSIPESFFTDTPIPIFPRCAPAELMSPKARPVFIDPFPWIIIESVIAVPAYDHLKTISEYRYPPVFYGQTLESLTALINRYAPRYDPDSGTIDGTVEIDYRSFDRIVPRHEANHIVKSYFEKIPNPTKLEKYAYEFILRRNACPISIQFEDQVFITYDISISGRILTTLISTGVNYCRQQFLNLHILEQKRLPRSLISLVCLGDDSLTRGPVTRHLNEVNIDRAFSSVFRADKPTVTVANHSSSQRVMFLGHYARANNIHRDLTEIIGLAVFPEHPITVDDKTALTYLRLKGLNTDSGMQHQTIADALKLIRSDHEDIEQRAAMYTDIYNRKFAKPFFILSL